MRHKRVISKHKDVVVGMDTTYWGRNFGLVIIMDVHRNKVLWLKFISRKERVADYTEGVEWLAGRGFRIHAAVCDGLKGLIKALSPIPTQMCQFHMIAIVKKLLTSKPDTEASAELLALAKTLSKRPREEFVEGLEAWHKKHCAAISEKRRGKDGKTHYVRPRLRTAYHSLKRHLPWLWTFEAHPNLAIPNTNASIESLNSRLKTTMRVHSGITAERRRKLLENFIATHY